jgi:hypothetical protein
MDIKEKQQVKKLKSLDELEVGIRIVMIADGCPYSGETVAVLKTKRGLQGRESFDLGKLQLINSYDSFGDLHVGIHKPCGKGRINEDGQLVVDSYETHQIASKFHNLGEFSEEMKGILLKAGYEIPRGVN